MTHAAGKKDRDDTRRRDGVPQLLIKAADAGSETARCEIILAHGAGAAMDSDFMEVFAEGLAERGFRVVRFEFPYMQRRRESGTRRPPDREPVLRETWRQVIAAHKSAGLAEKFFIGGKSLGGRIASLMVDQINQEADSQQLENKQPMIGGLICLGYPFHPPGKLDKLRTAHLAQINTPTLIVQGDRDTLGNRDEVNTYQLSSQIQIHWLADGDHSFVPRKASGRTAEQNWQEGVEAVAAFVQSLA